jgi:hypothetical protein
MLNTNISKIKPLYSIIKEIESILKKGIEKYKEIKWI